MNNEARQILEYLKRTIDFDYTYDEMLDLINRKIRELDYKELQEGNKRNDAKQI